MKNKIISKLKDGRKKKKYKSIFDLDSVDFHSLAKIKRFIHCWHCIERKEDLREKMRIINNDERKIMEAI